MTRKIAAILAAAALAISLGACSDDTDSGANPTVTITEEAPAPTGDEVFVATVRENAPNMSRGASDADLIELGETTCQALDTLGGDPEALFYALYEEDPTLDYGEVGALVGASISVYCPEYSGQIDDISSDA
jgi:hypothetical protein